MAKNYVSNSSESVRMFKNGLLEGVSKVHFTVPLYIYVPVICYFIYQSFSEGISVPGFMGYLAFGLILWTATEYVLHRFIFHYIPKPKWALRLHFIFHGVHHDYPRDKKRLVMPPSVSIPLAVGFYFLFARLISWKAGLYAFFPGFLIGYLIYDMLHYAMHHYNFKSGIMKKIKQHHMLHHYQDATKGFGVSSSLWDKVLHSDFSNDLGKE
ncbi:Fatty acid hydroxylase superfamily protein [Chitinophaga sp. CF118]|uniref:sterol desaturase family protein n=1 Tax=Chitinophaga sp. CF118 TaxID=1884367 RepID=UPI0008E2206A|nr:sterol desaturase family protein [Chitinophaga sp. CF118]SFD53785.1 Fatty acid hydroxylase superfamily protein [Chitinophaga sp. CF118]